MWNMRVFVIFVIFVIKKCLVIRKKNRRITKHNLFGAKQAFMGWRTDYRRNLFHTSNFELTEMSLFVVQWMSSEIKALWWNNLEWNADFLRTRHTVILKLELAMFRISQICWCLKWLKKYQILLIKIDWIFPIKSKVVIKRGKYIRKKISQESLANRKLQNLILLENFEKFYRKSINSYAVCNALIIRICNVRDMHSKFLRKLNQFIYMRHYQPYFHKIHNQTAYSTPSPPPLIPTHTEIIIYAKRMRKLFCISLSRIPFAFSLAFCITCTHRRSIFAVHLQFTYFIFLNWNGM